MSGGGRHSGEVGYDAEMLRVKSRSLGNGAKSREYADLSGLKQA